MGNLHCGSRGVALCVCAAMLVLLPANVLPAEGSAYVREDGRQLRAGNDGIEVVFAQKDGRLQSIVDKASGVDLISRKDAYWAPFTCAVAGEGGNLEYLVGASASAFHYGQARSPDGARLSLAWSGVRGAGPTPPRLDVRVTIDIPDKGTMTYWRLDVANGALAAVRKVDFPAIHGVGRMSRDPTNDQLLHPAMTGTLIRDPLGTFLKDRGFGWEMHYPSAFCPMQFMAYCSSETGTGWYLAALDGQAHSKFLCASKPNDDWLSLSISHVLPYTPVADPGPKYATALGSFRGGWYEAARLYRAWALSQAWTKTGRLCDRNDTPKWFKELGLYQWVFTYPVGYDINHFSTVAEVAEDTARYVGAPVAIDWIGWERSGWYSLYPDVFPPKEGWDGLEKTLAAVRRRGQRVCFIPSTTMCSSISTTWKTARPWACTDESGRLIRPAPHNVPGEPEFTLYRMCPGTRFWRDRLEELLLPLAASGGDILQLDGFPNIDPTPCCDTKHEHPPGGGVWWASSYLSILQRVKELARRSNPEVTFTSEGLAEAYLPILDGFTDSFTSGWSPASLSGACSDTSKAQLVPLWHAVYHDYAPIQSGITFVSRRGPKDTAGFGNHRLYYLWSLAISLTWGEVPTIWYYDEKLSALDEEPEREMAEYLKRIVQARTSYARPFLVYGQMLRSPGIRAPSLTIPAATKIPYTLADRPAFESPSVLSSRWRAPTGEIGYVLTNIGPQQTRVDLDISSEAGGLGPGGLAAYQVRNGVRGPITAGLSLPKSLSLSVAPRDVLLVVVAPAGSSQRGPESTGKTPGK